MVVNPNLENVISIVVIPKMRQLIRKENAVKELAVVSPENAVVNMDGVVNLIDIVMLRKDVNLNLVNVIKSLVTLG